MDKKKVASHRKETGDKASCAAQALQGKYNRGAEPTPQLFRHFRGHRGTINSLSFHPDLPYVISAGSDHHIFQWDYKDVSKHALRFEGHTAAVNDAMFNNTGELMLSGSDDLQIGVWVPLIRGDTHYLRGHSAPVRSVAFHPAESGYCISASDDKTVKLWNIEWSKTKRKTSLRSHEFIGSWCGHTNWVKSVRFNKDGSSAITASDDRTVQILDTRISEQAMKLTIGKGIPVHAEFNPTAANYFGVATSEEFHVYDIRNGKLVQCYLDIHVDNITKFNFHPSGDFAITISQDRTLKILDLIEGRPIFTLFGHSEAVKGVAISPNGMLVASGGKDKSVLMWKPILIPYTDKELTKSGILQSSDQETSETKVNGDSDGHAFSSELTSDNESRRTESLTLSHPNQFAGQQSPPESVDGEGKENSKY